MKIRVKRVYDSPAREDGTRVLIDRIWPRGLSKEKAAVDLWAKDIAPSTELRQWFRHDPENSNSISSNVNASRPAGRESRRRPA